MDMALAATFTIAMLAWWAWRESEKKTYLAIFYAALGLGMLAKGPVAPFLSAAIILLYAAAVRDGRVAVKTLWLPGIILFFAIALPWYFVVQLRNPEFFREFILQHNLERFSKNLYHHTEPFWYYVPVLALALIPWTVFVIAALIEPVRAWWANRSSGSGSGVNVDYRFGIFVSCWLFVPVIFFSISQSKLPGYILPAISAGGLLIANYLRQNLPQSEGTPLSVALAVLHALIAAAPIVPALLIAYILTQHRFPGGRPMLVALTVASILCVSIALTLMRRAGLRMLRFVTLIPLVLTMGAVLKLGTVALDQKLSARPLAREIASLETQKLPLAIYHIPRELEYGLTFYRNQLTLNYDWGSVPQEEHLLVAPENSQIEVAKLVAGRRVSYLGNFPAQHVDYYWIAAAHGGSAP
jgi:4-amino-4-deoxy-L-arabinose transferase-like glycosyltransferase